MEALVNSSAIVYIIGYSLEAPGRTGLSSASSVLRVTIPGNSCPKFKTFRLFALSI